MQINPLNAELNPICYLLALLGVHHILYVSRLGVKIQNYSVPAHGLCNLICGYQVFIQEILPVKRGPECSSRTFITMYQPSRCPNPDHIMNPY